MAGPAPRDQILWRERDKEKKNVPVQLTTSRIGSRTGLIQTLLKVLTILTAVLVSELYLKLLLYKIPGTEIATYALCCVSILYGRSCT